MSRNLILPKIADNSKCEQSLSFEKPSFLILMMFLLDSSGQRLRYHPGSIIAKGISPRASIGAGMVLGGDQKVPRNISMNGCPGLLE